MVLNTETAWAAGILDGEGCIYVDRTLRLMVVVIQAGHKEPAILRRLKCLFGGSLYLGAKARKPHHKQNYRWVLSGAGAESFLRSVHPFLVGKKTESAVAIVARETGKLGQARLRLQKLKQER